MAYLEFKSLMIENFKAFAGTHEIQLARAPGLYYITGQNRLEPELGANGVGKSTIFDALLWALFGRTGRDNRPAAAVHSWGIGKTTRVRLELRRGENPITVTRTRNPNRLMVDDFDGEREIQQDEIPKLIGMSETLLRYTLILGQFGTLFLDMKPEAQSQMFTEALQLDIWLAAANRASDKAKQAKSDVARHDRELARLDGVLVQLAEQIKEDERAAALFEQDRAAAIKKAKRGIAQMETDLEDLEAAPVERPELPANVLDPKLARESANAQAALRVLLNDIAANNDDIESAQARLIKIEKHKRKCEACGQQISAADWQAQRDKVAKEIAALTSILRGQEAEVKALKKTGDELGSRLQVESLRLDEARADYETDLEAWEEWQAKANAARSTKATCQADLKRAEQSTNLAQDRIDAAKQKQVKEEEAQAAIAIAKADAETLEQDALFWVDAFREIRLSIIDETLIELEMAATRHAGMLGLVDWAIRFETERETKSGSTSYAFNVLLFPPGRDEPVKWESYSGGESQRWQLAVAFGLSEVLLARAGLTPNLEILDEPTRGLSAQGVEDLLEHLRTRALELGRAIYFVDHHSLDKGMFDGVLMVQKDKSGAYLLGG